MSQLNTQSVLQALSQVQDPDLKDNLVSLGMIQDLVVSEQGAVSFRVVLTTPACPVKAQMEAECRTRVEALPGVTLVTIVMDAVVKPRRETPSQGSSPSVKAATSRPIRGVSHVIAVSSGKGGVGKSTVAVNLATSLALDGARVGLMDADVYGPNVPTMMGVTDSVKIEKDDQEREMFVPPLAHGVKVMSMGFLIQGDQPVIWRGPMLHSLVTQFCHQVNWGELDYLVVDMPPGTGDVQLSLAQLVPVTGAVLVSTPQEVSMQDVRKAFFMFEKVRVPVLGIVENMSYFQCPGCEEKHFLFGQGGGQVLARKFRTPLLAALPLYQGVAEGGEVGQPIVVREPQSLLAQSFRALAGRVAQEISILVNQEGKGLPQIEIGAFH